MKITPIRTHPIVKGDKIENVLDKFVKKPKDETIVAVTSKIVSICEGRLIPIYKTDKKTLIMHEAELYLPANLSKYDFPISIKNNLIGAAAGIDESNGNGYFVLWPKDPQKSANKIREYLSKKFGIQHLGIIITDSKLSPLRPGVTGYSLSQSGFRVLNSYVGRPDIFGRKMKVEKLNLADSLASAAVAVMGEGNEQTPIAIIEGLNNVEFQDRNPTKKELDQIKIKIEDDIYAPLLTSVQWRKGKGKV